MFKKDFVWGVATASYQIEGGVKEGGRTPSTWDIFSHQKGKTYCGQNGDVACDSYGKYKEDIDLLGELGVNAYRFSVSWNRIFPEGTGKINQAGVDYYNRLIDGLLEKNIAPYITMFHWDYPYCLYQKGGWLNPDSPKWFGEYAETLVRKFGDRVKNFITFNEPQCFIGLGHQDGTHAPGLRLGEPDLSYATKNVLLSHGMAVSAIRANAPKAKIGYAPCGTFTIPYTNSKEDIEAARRKMFAGSGMWENGRWYDPILLGIFPEAVAREIGEPTEAEMKLISQDIDFLGANIYQGEYIRADENGNPVHVDSPVGHFRTSINWPVTPDCLYWAAKFFYERYKKPFYITENGMANNDCLDNRGKCADPQRIQYLRMHIEGLRRAAAEGVDVCGYFQWSLMDNFEWAEGYNQRFGLVYMDYAAGKRIPKDSFYYYKKVVESNGNDL